MIVKPLANLINMIIECSKFPNNAMVTPLHKKNSNLDKENYRPAILPVISKINEKAINEQSSNISVNISMFNFLHSDQDMNVRAHS